MRKNRKTRQNKIDRLNYQVNISYDPRDEIYVAKVPELENCHSHGMTPDEALANAREAVTLWLETARRRKIPIPEPLSKKKFSGKFLLRTPAALHAHLAKTALHCGKSMNEFTVELISEALRKVS